MSNSTNKNKNAYGHLLDKYLDGNYDYRTDGQKEEEARTKYGHLLDYAKPDNSIWDNILGVYESCDRMNQRRRDESERDAASFKERIERERREEEEHNAKVAAYAESLIKRKREEEEAKAKAEAERRKEAEEQQKVLDRVRWMVDMRDQAGRCIEGCK